MIKAKLYNQDHFKIVVRGGKAISALRRLTMTPRSNHLTTIRTRFHRMFLRTDKVLTMTFGNSLRLCLQIQPTPLKTIFHPTGAGANMSPGNQILALTATSASANRTTIRAGRSVVRKKDNGVRQFRRHSAWENGAAAGMRPPGPQGRTNRCAADAAGNLRLRSVHRTKHHRNR